MTLKKKTFAVLLVIISIVSIAISAWQYQVNDDDMDWGGESFTNACKKFPFNYVRPFQISRSGEDKPAYCGYGLANTAFRLAVGCVTCILGALLPFDLLKEAPSELLYWVFFVLTVFWFSAAVSDCTALVNSTEACVDWWEDTVTYHSYSCENGIYGVTIAFDIAASLIVLLCWILCDGMIISQPSATRRKVPFNDFDEI
eukprot:gene8102-8933_t